MPSQSHMGFVQKASCPSTACCQPHTFVQKCLHNTAENQRTKPEEPPRPNASFLSPGFCTSPALLLPWAPALRQKKNYFFFSLFSLLYGFYSPTSSTEHSCPQGAPHGPWAAPWVRAGAKESQSLKCALHQDQEAEGDSLSSLQGCAPAVKPSQEATDVKQPR